MKKVLYTIILFFGILSLSNAQAKQNKHLGDIHRNIYGEYAGAHIGGGLNIDLRMKRGRMDGLGFRFGIGGYRSTGTSGFGSTSYSLVTLPLELNYVYTLYRNHALVGGVGIAPAYQENNNLGNILGGKADSGIRLKSTFGQLGYRYQTMKKFGLFFQATWTPMYVEEIGFKPGWFSVGLGIGLKTKG